MGQKSETKQKTEDMNEGKRSQGGGGGDEGRGGEPEASGWGGGWCFEVLPTTPLQLPLPETPPSRA